MPLVDEGSSPRHFRAALVGTLAVAWALFGSRWGAYVGVAPVFLTDVLLALALVHWAVTRAKFPREPPLRKGIQGVHPALLLFVAWSILRFVGGMRFDMTALRDAAPYIYSVVGVASALAIRRATRENRARTTSILYAALFAHFVWSFIVFVAFPSLPDMLPLISAEQALPILRPRSDFDTPVLAVFATWVLIDLAMGRRQRADTSIALIIASWVAIFMSDSRAGLVGALLVGTVGVAVLLRSSTVSRKRQLSVLAVLPLVFGTVLIVVPQLEIGDRIAGTFGTTSSQAATGAGGTTEARAQTWRYLLNYSTEDNLRFLVGVGHGPNFMSETEAGLLLVGSAEDATTNPRSPHNYWLGTLLREGVVGATLFLIVVVAFLRRSLSLLARLSEDALLMVSVAVPIALIVPATLGVVLEAPFGAVPFFWALGIVLATGREGVIPKPLTSSPAQSASCRGQ